MRRVCHTCGTTIPAGSRCDRHAGTTRTRGRTWMSVRDQILTRDGGACQIGGEGCTRIATQVDHIVPLIAGGTDDPLNLRAACQTCNQRKG